VGRTNDHNEALFALGLLAEFGTIEGRTRFQKIVYLAQRERNVPQVFRFIPYYYGPYSKSLTNLISFFKTIGFLEERRVKLGLDVFRYDYSLTERGMSFYERILRTLGEQATTVRSTIKRVASELRDVPTTVLVSRAKKLALGKP